MTRRRRLVAVAWQRPGTGMTRVADRLLGSLGPGWAVDLVGVGYDGPVRVDGSVTRHPTDPDGRDVFGAHAAADSCRRGEAPDAVLVHNDLWLLGRYADVVGAARRDAPLLAYLPLDGEPDALAGNLVGGLSDYTAIALYTSWARDALTRALAEVDFEPPRLEVVPHGVDVACFRPAGPLADPPALATARTALKRRLLPRLDNPERTVLVLNANRPDVRKRVDVSLDAFARLRAQVPDVEARLVLHHALTTPATARALRERARTLGIEDVVLLDPLGGAELLPDDALADLMAACEIGLNTSTGEGWGLLAFEHAATGGAQVLGRHSAHEELWHDAAVLVEPARRSVGRSSPLTMAELDPGDVGDALAALVSDPDRRHEVAVRCHRRALDPRFSWGVAQHAFQAFVERACAERSHR